MLVVADINTIWRRKPFEALAQWEDVLGLAPRRWATASPIPIQETPRFKVRKISLPPGWASKWSKLSAIWLWHTSRHCAAAQNKRITALMVTSPHYLNLAKLASRQVPVFYYGSDDYSQYAGWGGERILKKEAELVRLANHAFFVSSRLADRAAQSYGIESDRLSVSANATDPHFLLPASEDRMQKLRTDYSFLKRPWVGVVGTINSRIDFELLERCASMTEVGSLLLIGGCEDKEQESSFSRLRNSPKCHFLGHQPHDDLPLWMQALDVALIPYRDTPLNRACSPMRLYDHLASGRPIVATSVNDQLLSMRPHVRCAVDAEDFIENLRQALLAPLPRQSETIKLIAKEHLWSARAAAIHRATHPSKDSHSLDPQFSS